MVFMTGEDRGYPGHQGSRGPQIISSHISNEWMNEWMNEQGIFQYISNEWMNFNIAQMNDWITAYFNVVVNSVLPQYRNSHLKHMERRSLSNRVPCELYIDCSRRPHTCGIGPWTARASSRDPDQRSVPHPGDTAQLPTKEPARTFLLKVPVIPGGTCQHGDWSECQLGIRVYVTGWYVVCDLRRDWWRDLVSEFSGECEGVLSWQVCVNRLTLSGYC